MARWGTKGNKGSASVQSVLVMMTAASNMRRFRMYDWTIGIGAAPADNAYTHVCQRTSAVGSLAGSTKTPNALDPADSLASVTVVTDTVTVDPTITAGAYCLWKALNQRATFRWVAAPYSEIVVPATATVGIILGLSAANVTTADYDALYEEL